MSWRSEEASRRSGAEDSAAGVALGVLELLEVLWSQGETVSTAPLSSSQVRVLYVLEREGYANAAARTGHVPGAAPAGGPCGTVWSRTRTVGDGSSQPAWTC
ncbi:hypothetical protein [Streptomyces cinereoruber]|uniref:hypothetical protein n=1 Tax=Streptomyces cinereoruber TaxID=67260 RepID=UPI003C2BAE48